MNIQEIITKVRLLEIDHTPEGYPAIQMQEVSALVNELELLKYRLERINHQKEWS